jgi:soluble lytic murein transglycosylase-like protein
MENQETVRFKWMSGQNSLVFFLVGIIIVLCSLMNRNVSRLQDSEHRRASLVTEHVLLQKENAKLTIENDEVKRLKFKEEYYAKRNENLSKCLDAAWVSGKKYGVKPSLIMWIQYVESRHQPDLISNKGAMGVMQVMYSVWHKELDIDISKMFEIPYNTDLGARIIAGYLRETGGNVIEALKLYNGGYKYKEFTGTYSMDVVGAGTTKIKLVSLKNSM